MDRNMELAARFAQKVAEAGGRAYYVGGFVRDRLLGRENKDIDIEVHGLVPDRVREIIALFGPCMENGISFGVFGIKGYDLDIALPRTERCTGAGHRSFDVFTDPFLGTTKAAERRDFTINAMMQDVLTDEILDPFHGQQDLQAGILRHVSDASFPEDPLRVFRACQFAARFGFSIAPETAALCASMDTASLACERVMEELRKGMLKSDRPSLFFEGSKDWLAMRQWFPELLALQGVPQNPAFHPEGDVWTHSLLVLDRAVAFKDRAQNPFGFMLAALTHDFGKPATTVMEKGRLRSIGHETAGLPVISAMLNRLTNEHALKKYVLNLAELHMKPNMYFSQNASLKATNRMYDAAMDPEALIWLAQADRLGSMAPRCPEAEEFLLQRLAAYRETMAQPYVAGADLIKAGLKPGPDFADCLAYAHRLRLACVPKESVLKQTLAYAEEQRRKQS